MAEYHFRFAVGYGGEIEWTVSAGNETGRVRVRHEASDYFKSISTYSDLDWRREVVASIDLLRWDNRAGRSYMPSVALVDAFNAWRLADYTAQRDSILAQPERYGIASVAEYEALSWGLPPRMVRGAVGEHHWVDPNAYEVWNHGSVWCGWQTIGETPAERLARLELTHQSYGEKHARYIMERCNGKRSQADCDVVLAEYQLAAALLLEAQLAGAPPVAIVGDSFRVEAPR